MSPLEGDLVLPQLRESFLEDGVAVGEVLARRGHLDVWGDALVFETRLIEAHHLP